MVAESASRQARKKFKKVADAISKAFGCECEYMRGEKPNEVVLTVKWGAGKAGFWTVEPGRHAAVFTGDEGSPFCESFIQRALLSFKKDVAPELPKRFDGAMSIPLSANKHGHCKSKKKLVRACPALEKLVTGRSNPNDHVQLSQTDRQFARTPFFKRLALQGE